ncbi:MAG: sulfatase-like hydrolase/transferase, partial [Chloroflexi bacterium]|nr:sulfatase-like hydrolase/transferase [Chloroflexota bacterium]
MTLTNLPDKPNIVIIITDQEREVMHWPEGWAEENLQARRRLMANGLSFRNAHCNTAACTPSRATLMTGLYPAQHGLKSLLFCDDPNEKWQRSRAQLSPDTPNIANVLAEAGYHVVLKGKFHLSRPVKYDGELQRHYWSDADIPFMAERYGFQEWNPPDMSDPIGISDYGGGNINNDGRYVDGTGTAAGKPMPEDEQFRQSAVHFLNSYAGDKPFCLIVSLVNPHDAQGYPGRGVQNPFGRKPIYEQAGYKLEDFENLPIDLPPTVDEDISTKPAVHTAFRRVTDIGLGNMRSRTRQRNYARFYAYLCRKVDKEISKVLDALDANGLTEDTVVIRTSDHGELGMAHGKMREKFYNTYRESLNVPLIFSNPKLYPEPQTTESFAGLVDLLPTLAAIAGVPNPERFEFRGKDLTPILANPESEVQDYVHFTYEDDQFPTRGAANCIRAIVEKDWKYAVYYDPFKGAPVEYEMYNLKDDPYEATNLAHPANYQPAYAEDRRRLHNRLIEVMKVHGTTPPEVTFPTTEAYEQNYEAPSDVYHDPIPGGIKRRQRLYQVIMVLAGLAAVYQVAVESAFLLTVVGSLITGVLLGLILFSRMTQLSWDDENGMIETRMDFAAILILLVYVVFVLLADTPLLRSIITESTANGAGAALVAGIMFGQINSLRRKIRNILGSDSSRDYSASVDIDAPAQQVWDVVTDFKSYPSWNPLLSNVEGELTVGGKLRVKPAFAPVAVPATVTMVDKPNHFEWEDHVPLNLLTPVFSVHLLPLTNNRTRVIIAESFTGPLLPLAGRRLDRQMPPLYDAMAQALVQQVQQR